MISKPNINDATATGRNARFSFTGMLLLGLGVLLNLFEPAIAAPGNGAPARSGKAIVYNYTFTIIKDYSVSPSGVDELEVSVSPAPPAGTQISISFGGTTSLIATTDASGNAYFYFTNTTAGTVTVTIKDNTGTIVGTTDMHFISTPGPPDPAKSYFAVIQNPAAADGVAQDIVEAFLYDQYGNPINYGASVNWTIESGTASFVGSPNTTTPYPSSGSNGTSTISLTSTTVGVVDVQATVSYTDPSTSTTVNFQLGDQNTPPNNYLAVQFVQPQPNPTTSFIVAKITPNPANGTSLDEVQATVYTASGALYNGPITFTIESGTATPVTISTTVVNGIATATYSSTTVGSVQVQAQVTVSGVPTYLNDQANPANNYVTIQFVNPPPDLSQSYITPVITPMPADGSSQDEVEAYVVSSAGVPLANGTLVTFTIISGTGTIVTTTTLNNGIATAFLTSTVVGSVEVQATYTDPATSITYTLFDKNTPSQNYSIVQFVTGPVDQSKSYIVVTQDGAAADGTSKDIVTAYLYDAQGHPITSGATINWSTESGTATLSGTTSSSNTIAASYVSTVVGAVQVQAQVTVGGSTFYLNDQNNPTNNYVTIHFVVSNPVPGQPGGGGAGGTNPGSGGQTPGSGGSGSNGGGGGGGTGPGSGNNSGPTDNSGFTVLYIEPAYNYRLADGQSQDSVFAYITDAYKHPVPGVQVTFFMQTTPTAGTITSGANWVGSPVNVVTGADGIARIAMTSTAPGTVFVDATIVDPTTGNTVLIDGSYQVAVFVNKPDVTNILTSLTVIIGEALDDGIQQNEVKAHVVDIDGNVMPNQQVVFSVDSGTGTIITPQPVVTDANGDAYIQITSKTAGYVLITAVIDDSLKIIYGSPARVKFAPINIYVPRVFTPNNDGTNDILKPILVGISTFHYFNVYNRWGNLVFTTQDPNQGWDGTFKGVAQPVETYLWIAEGIDENGKKVVQKGMTSLVR